MRLLLAEDEKELSAALTAVLEHNHYSVDAVYDGQDALDYALTENYDGIILDIMMPKKSGLEVLAAAQQYQYADFDAHCQIRGQRPGDRTGYRR